MSQSWARCPVDSLHEDCSPNNRAFTKPPTLGRPRPRLRPDPHLRTAPSAVLPGDRGSSSPPRRGGVMDDARLFLCARCRRQVLICSVCDRGQQYCGARCSDLARNESLRAAGRRYQQSRRGRHCHAERQRRYRRRRREGACREIVTHQGSASSRCGVALVHQRVLRREASPSMSPKPATKRARATSGTSKMHCHFCARPISEFVRLHWRRSPIRRRARPGALH